MSDNVKFRVWCENGDFLGEFDNLFDAEECVKALQEACPCDTEGLPECGVIAPHGYFLDIEESGYVHRNTYLY